MPKNQLVSPGDSLERGGCSNGSAVRKRGGGSVLIAGPRRSRIWIDLKIFEMYNGATNKKTFAGEDTGFRLAGILRRDIQSSQV